MEVMTNTDKMLNGATALYAINVLAQLLICTLILLPYTISRCKQFSFASCNKNHANMKIKINIHVSVQ
jgi:hypothetical protein